jgi:hypothetical protein
MSGVVPYTLALYTPEWPPKSSHLKVYRLQACTRPQWNQGARMQNDQFTAIKLRPSIRFHIKTISTIRAVLSRQNLRQVANAPLSRQEHAGRPFIRLSR